MWGCELVDTDPATIGKVHAGYAAAGADIVTTAS